MKSLLLLALFFPPLLWSQQGAPKDGDPLPKWKVDIDRRDGKQVLLPSPAMPQLPQCRGRMCYAVFALDPEHGFQEVIAAFTLSGQSHFVDPSLIQGLTYVTISDFGPTEDGGVIVLIHAVEQESLPKSKAALGSNTSSASTPNEAGSSHAYFAVYDSNGQLSGLHQLDLPFKPVRMANLTDREIVASGFDPVKNRPVLAVVGTDGSMLRLLDDQGTLPNATALMAGITLKVDRDAPALIQQIALSGALSRLTFGYAGGRVLLLDPGENAAIWSIKGTQVDKTSLKMPRGVVAASIVPSDGPWLIRAFVSATDTGLLLEFDPETGELKRQVDSGGVPGTSIFLESENTFYAFWWDNQNHSFVVGKSS